MADGDISYAWLSTRHGRYVCFTYDVHGKTYGDTLPEDIFKRLFPTVVINPDPRLEQD